MAATLEDRLRRLICNPLPHTRTHTCVFLGTRRPPPALPCPPAHSLRRRNAQAFEAVHVLQRTLRAARRVGAACLRSMAGSCSERVAYLLTTHQAAMHQLLEDLTREQLSAMYFEVRPESSRLM